MINYTIRKPKESDAEEIIRYSKKLFKESDQLLTTLEEYNKTIEEQAAWINDSLNNPTKLILVAESDGKLVGLLFFATMGRAKVAHTGEFGVSVDKEFRSSGIGRSMVEQLIQWALGNPKIEKIFLQVFASNTRAIKLYTEMGFLEEGRHVKAVKQMSGAYTDIVQMYRLMATDR